MCKNIYPQCVKIYLLFLTNCTFLSTDIKSNKHENLLRRVPQIKTTNKPIRPIQIKKSGTFRTEHFVKMLVLRNLPYSGKQVICSAVSSDSRGEFSIIELFSSRNKTPILKLCCILVCQNAVDKNRCPHKLFDFSRS